MTRRSGLFREDLSAFVTECVDVGDFPEKDAAEDIELWMSHAEVRHLRVLTCTDLFALSPGMVSGAIAKYIMRFDARDGAQAAGGFEW
jgi:hypothetical protein